MTAPTRYCSFCSKSQHEVRELVDGFGAFICDGCVDICREAIAEHRAKKDVGPEVVDLVAALDRVQRSVDEALKDVSELVRKLPRAES